MALPKEPRQKMINLMYLVLTALLALNVSSEILNAFRTVNNSLEKTNVVINTSTSTYLASLQAKLTEPESQVKAKEWYPIAQHAQNLSSGAYNFVQNIKDSLLRAADFNPQKNGDSTYKEDDLEASTRILVEQDLGEKLHQQLKSYFTQLMQIDPRVNKEFSGKLPIDTSMPKVQDASNRASWASAYFHMTPTIAALTILSKFQNDIKTSENRIISYCHSQVGQVEVRFDQYAPIVGASSTYLMDGQEIEITAGLGAFNSQKRPTVTINGSTVALSPDGLAHQKFIASGIGEKSATVVINYIDQDGKPQSKNVQIPYKVGSPTGASVSFDAVKVLYIGLDNPVSVSGGIVGDERINFSIDNGTSTKDKPGHYIVSPGKAGNANITLTIDGKPQTFPCRVKNVPDPIAMVGASKGGRMRVNDFKAQQGVRAELENFIFEGVHFTVTNYTIVFQGPGFAEGLQYRQVKGNSFNEVKDLIEKCKPGTAVTIDEVKASGPGGSRQLPPIPFNLY